VSRESGFKLRFTCSSNLLDVFEQNFLGLWNKNWKCEDWITLLKGLLSLRGRTGFISQNEWIALDLSFVWMQWPLSVVSQCQGSRSVSSLEGHFGFLLTVFFTIVYSFLTNYIEIQDKLFVINDSSNLHFLLFPAQSQGTRIFRGNGNKGGGGRVLVTNNFLPSFPQRDLPRL